MKVDEMKRLYGKAEATIHTKSAPEIADDDDFDDLADELNDALALLREAKNFLAFVANTKLFTVLQEVDRSEAKDLVVVMDEFLKDYESEDTTPKNILCSHYKTTTCILQTADTNEWCKGCKEYMAERLMEHAEGDDWDKISSLLDSVKI